MKKLRHRPPSRLPVLGSHAQAIREMSLAIDRSQATAAERARLYQLAAAELKQRQQYLIDAGFTVAEAFQLLLAEHGGRR